MNQAGVKFLQRCFSEAEWVLLIKTPAFQQRLERLESFDEAERLIPFGLSIVQRAAMRNGLVKTVTECFPIEAFH